MANALDTEEEKVSCPQPCSVSSQSHSAMEHEGRVDPAGRKGESASHGIRKGRKVMLKTQNQETGGGMIQQKGEMIG